MTSFATLRSTVDRIDADCEVRIAELGNLAGIVGAALAANDHISAIVP